MKKTDAHAEVPVSARASEVTYARDADGNLVKVRIPAKEVSSRKANAAKAKPRRATKPRSGAPSWTLPIPRVVRLVAESVAARYGVTVGAILSGERFRHTVRARHEWWRLVRDTWDLSYPETGRLVGGVDHTTIMDALREREAVARKAVAHGENKMRITQKKMSPNQPVGTL